MRIIDRKTVLWVLLALSAGGTLLFALIVSHKGFPTGREARLNTWPAASTLTAAASGWMLRRLYRREPSTLAGFWHLSIADLALGSLVFGGTLGFIQGVLDDVPFTPAVMVSVIMTTAILSGLLTGSRMNFPTQRQRYTFGICLGLGMVGLLIVGSVLTASIAISFDQSYNILRGFEEICSIVGQRSGYSAACRGLLIFIPALLIALRMRHTSLAPISPVRELNSQATAPSAAPRPSSASRHVSTF